MTLHDLMEDIMRSENKDRPVFRKPVCIEEADGTLRPVRRVRVGRHAVYLIPENPE